MISDPRRRLLSESHHGLKLRFMTPHFEYMEFWLGPAATFRWPASIFWVLEVRFLQIRRAPLPSYHISSTIATYKFPRMALAPPSR
jgi:hypothetical protein